MHRTGNCVPRLVCASSGSELFLVGFRLSWGAIPAVAPPSAPSNGLTELQQLLASLQLYVRVRDDGSKLQLLRTTVVGITCASLVRLYEGLSLMRQRYAVSPLTQGVRPEMRVSHEAPGRGPELAARLMLRGAV